MKTPIDIAIIGAGAAGLMAAITSKENNPNVRVSIFEKTNKALAKVRISGGGRCNVTNATFSISKLVKNYPRGGKQLKKAFSFFNTKHTVKWFETRGVKLKTEADNRMFPISNNSKTIVDLLLNTAEKLDIKIIYKSNVSDINPRNRDLLLTVNKEKLTFDKLIIASGGSAKFNGLEFLNNLSCKIVSPLPSLFTFNMPNNSIIKLMGLSVNNVIASIKGSKLKQEGSLLITHWGMSGPAILKLSAWGAKELAKLNYNFCVGINWIAKNEEDVRSVFEKLRLNNKLVYNFNPFNIPKRLWFFLVNKIDISESQTWNNLSKKNKNKLINTLINDQYPVLGKTTFKEEFVTCGGVDLAEVNLSTMQSKSYENIFFAGEVLNIDGITGGFNFQAAWTTGYLAGKNCVL
jgi:hypothetical protein